MSVIATRYAESLFELAKEEKQTEEYAKDMQALSTIFEEDPALVRFFAHVLVEDDSKYKVIDETLSGQIQAYICNFLKLLIKKRRIGYIVEICKEFHELYFEHLGIEEGTLFTSFDISEEKVKEIEQAVSRKEGKTIQLRIKKDTSVIGGIKIQLKNHVIDGSIQNQLETLKKELLRK